MPNQDGSVTTNDDVIVVDSFDTEGLKKNLETTLAQKKHFREKFEKEVAERATLQKKLEEYEKASKLATEQKPQEPKPAIQDFDNLYENFEVIRSLESDEFAELRSTAKELGVDPVKYVKSKAGQAHLKEFRSTKKTEESTPTPSNRVPVFNGKPVMDVLRDEKASPADKQKAYEALFKKGGNHSI